MKSNLEIFLEVVLKMAVLYALSLTVLWFFGLV